MTDWSNKSEVLGALIYKYYSLVESGESPIEMISDELLGDREIALAALRQNWELTLGVLKHAGSHARGLLGDRAFMLAAIEEKDRQFKSDTGAGNTEYCITWYASDALKNDRDFVLAAVSIHGSEIDQASDELRNDRELVLTAVKNQGMALHDALDIMKNDREIVLAAVTEDGNALISASEELQGDPEIVLAALANAPQMVKYVKLREHEALQTNPEVVLAVLAHSPEEAKYAKLSVEQWAEIRDAWQAHKGIEADAPTVGQGRADAKPWAASLGRRDGASRGKAGSNDQ